MNMEENNQVHVFEKKELIIIFLMFLVLVVTSFTLGIRLGKKLALPVSSVQTADPKPAEMKSPIEEEADEALSQDQKMSEDEKLKKMMDESKNRLTTQLEQFAQESGESSAPEEDAPLSTMVGKFTIQLGSYNTMDEAKQFAEGFTVRGYNPIINEVKIDGKGKWYRVSLGLFNTAEEAKKYIKDEQSLFSGQDHIITEIK